MSVAEMIAVRPRVGPCGGTARVVVGARETFLAEVGCMGKSARPVGRHFCIHGWRTSGIRWVVVDCCVWWWFCGRGLPALQRYWQQGDSGLEAAARQSFCDSSGGFKATS